MSLGPEHPDTQVRPRAEPLVRTADRTANMIEIAKERSLFPASTECNTSDTKIEEYEEEEEEDIFYDMIDDYYLGQIAENPEN